MRNRLQFSAFLVACGVTFAATSVSAQPSKAEWEKAVESAKKEGKAVVSIPASPELRKLIEEGFKKRYSGIDLELFPARGTSITRRIVEESKAGVGKFLFLLLGAGGLQYDGRHTSR